MKVLVKWWLGIHVHVPISSADSKCFLCSKTLDPDGHNVGLELTPLHGAIN